MIWRKAIAGTFLFIIIAVASPNARASLLVSVSGQPDVNNSPSIDNNQFIAIEWTATQSYSNVTISADLFDASNYTGSAIIAYLTSAIGSNATGGNGFISDVSDMPSSSPTFTNLFSGLTLSAGNYYLILAPYSVADVSNWTATSAATINTDSSVTFDGELGASPNFGGAFNSSYPPASDFVPIGNESVLFQVTGDVVPEPSNLFALAAMALLGRRFHRKH